MEQRVAVAGADKELKIVLPAADDHVVGRDFVVQGEMLEIWLMLRKAELTAEQLAGLEVFVSFEEQGLAQIGDVELSERKPRHVPSVSFAAGWERELRPGGALLRTLVPVLLRTDLQRLVLRASVKSPVFAAPPSLNDLEDQVFPNAAFILFVTEFRRSVVECVLHGAANRSH